MVVVNKITQLNETRVPVLRALAVAEGVLGDTDVAKWIIARSPWWKSKGYDEIMRELEKADAGKPLSDPL